MRTVWCACLLAGSVSGASFAAYGDLSQDKHPFSRLCGNLRYIDRKYEGNTVKDSNEKRLRKVKLQLYTRVPGEECCSNSQLVQEETTGFMGGFHFRNISDGQYWLVTSYNNAIYRMPVRVVRDKRDVRECFDQRFMLLSDGKFEEWEVVTLDGD